jgi:hypothetical protein
MLFFPRDVIAAHKTKLVILFTSLMIEVLCFLIGAQTAQRFKKRYYIGPPSSKISETHSCFYDMRVCPNSQKTHFRTLVLFLVRSHARPCPSDAAIKKSRNWYQAVWCI